MARETVEIRLSDMHCLRVEYDKAGHSTLIPVFYFQGGLTAFGFFPHVTAQSVDWLCNSLLTCFSLVS